VLVVVARKRTVQNEIDPIVTQPSPRDAKGTQRGRKGDAKGTQRGRKGDAKGTERKRRDKPAESRGCEPHRKGVANHPDLEPCAGGGDIAGEALDREIGQGDRGQPPNPGEFGGCPRSPSPISVPDLPVPTFPPTFPGRGVHRVQRSHVKWY
jgi:hypothetical protein